MKPEKKSGPFRMWAMALLLLLFLLLVVGVLFILGRELIVRLDAGKRGGADAARSLAARLMRKDRRNASGAMARCAFKED